MDGRTEIDQELTSGLVAEQDKLPVTDEQRNDADRRLNASAVDRNPGRLVSKVITEIRRRRGPLK
jgi:hypothetical protein